MAKEKSVMAFIPADLHKQVCEKLRRTGTSLKFTLIQLLRKWVAEP